MRADPSAQLRKGVVEYCVLGLLSREPMYGWQLSETLASHGVIASIGTLYPILTRLREKGFVSSYEMASESGPVRRYYRLTESGQGELDTFRRQWLPFTQTVSELIGESHV